MSRLPLALVAALTLVACDSQEPEEPGSFHASIRGDIERDLEGGASFVTYDDGRGFRVTLSDGLPGEPRVPSRSLDVFDFAGQVRGPGTYRLDGSDLEAVNARYADAGSTGAVWAASSGTLRVTLFEDDRIEGALESDLEWFDLDTAENLRATVRATFEAVRSDA